MEEGIVNGCYQNIPSKGNRTMYFRKTIIFSAIVLFLAQGCSTSRKLAGEKDFNIDGGRVEDLTSIGVKRNISGKDLIISRARIQYNTEEFSTSVSAFIKYNAKGELLISLRSVAGIEVARAFINNDSIKLHDRINNVLYIQSVKYLKNLYGIGGEDIVLLWGDLPPGLASLIAERKKKGQVAYNIKKSGTEYYIEFDSVYLKTKKVTVSNIKGINTKMDFDNYITDQGLIYPGNAEINVNNGEMLIRVKYSGAKREKIKSMKFTPGKNTTVRILK